MWRQIISAAVLAISLADASAANRFSAKIMQRESIKADMRQKALDAATQGASNSTDSSNYRFFNKNTAPYRVTSLPDVPYDIGEMYAGNIPVDYSDPNRTLFFIFQPTIGKAVDEVTIWLNGGPGCSSMDGFFQENGRFLWQPGVYRPQINPYSWVNLTNMLWVDQPIGTGYSTGNPNATTEVQTAKEFANFFKNFQDKFGIKKFKIFVTGESYAGRYVPYISAEFLNRKDKVNFDLHGAIVYDGVIGAFEYTQWQVPMYNFVKQNSILFNFNDTFMSYLKEANTKCGYQAIIDKYLTFPPPGNQPLAPVGAPNGDYCDLFDAVNNAAFAVNPCFDLYGINQQCPLLWDVKGFPTELVFEYPGYEVYFNRTDVKKALHAPLNINWAECSGPVFVGGANGSGGPEGEGDLSPDPIQHVLPQVIEGTNRVLVANGEWDMIIQTNGTMLAIQNMTWNGKLGFQSQPNTPIDIQIPDLQYADVFAANGVAGLDGPQGVMGTQHYERGLMWASTRQCGHMQPQDQPRSSFRHLQWLLGYTNTL